MVVTKWAESILHNGDLASKLQACPETSSYPQEEMTSRPLPLWPERAPQIQILKEGASKNQNTRFYNDLESDTGRAAIFHFFANHELLALELMALALLKFPHLPSSFRRGLVATMHDEQKHLRFYLQRMQDLGMEFGELPLNSFFWRCIAPVMTPEIFLASMSLTFEQANLDFSLHYMKVFQTLGDSESAEHLKTVYEDELAHVHFGQRWLSYFKPPEKTLWEYYQENLASPLSPARAKGIIFDEKGRRRAGLEENFIAHLKVYNRSKGRPPRLYVMNIGSSQPSRLHQEFNHDLSSLFFLAAPATDAVYLSQPPSTSFLTYLVEKGGLEPAEIITPKNVTEPRLIEKVVCFSTDHDLAAYEEKLLTQLQMQVQKPSSSVNYLSDKKEQTYQILAKIGMPAPGFFARDLADVYQSAPQNTPLLCKGDRASSGQGHFRFSCPMSQDEERKLQRILTQFSGGVIEPLHERVADISLLIDTTRRDPWVGLYRTIVSPRGAFSGVWHQEDPFFDFSKKDREILYSSSHLNLKAIYRHLAIQVRQELKNLGYEGPASLDGYIYREGENLVLRPICEINVRWTMGRLFHEFLKYRRSPGIWILCTQQELALLEEEKTYPNLVSWFERHFDFVFTASDPQRTLRILPVYLSDPDLVQKIRSHPLLARFSK